MLSHTKEWPTQTNSQRDARGWGDGLPLWLEGEETELSSLLLKSKQYPVLEGTQAPTCLSGAYVLDTRGSRGAFVPKEMYLIIEKSSESIFLSGTHRAMV